MVDTLCNLKYGKYASGACKGYPLSILKIARFKVKSFNLRVITILAFSPGQHYHFNFWRFFIGLIRVYNERLLVSLPALGVWATKSQELLGHKPIEVTVLNLLIMFVFFIVEVVKIEEVSLFCSLYCPQAIQNSDCVNRYAIGSIPK